MKMIAMMMELSARKALDSRRRATNGISRTKHASREEPKNDGSEGQVRVPSNVPKRVRTQTATTDCRDT